MRTQLSVCVRKPDLGTLEIVNQKGQVNFLLIRGFVGFDL